MTYEEALLYISNRKRYAKRACLDRMFALMHKLGNPQNSLKFIHVAGTNGKGSICTYLANILKEAGFKTGLYTSPYIYEFNERIRINGENIKKDELAEIIPVVKEKTEELMKEGIEEPTEFEIITAAAFLYFSKKNCDFVVLEVGLGGRFDATNIIKAPCVSVIASVSLDHTECLGNTIGEIAFEKCGIIKEKRPVICYPIQHDDVYKVIEETAKEKNCSMHIVNTNELNIISCGMDGSVFDVEDLKEMKISLCGKHQIYNALTALSAIDELCSQGYKVTSDAKRAGLFNAKWPARFEKIYEEPSFYIDGAHNYDGMRMFCETVKEFCAGKNVIVIWGMLKNKNADKCAKMLSDICDILITTNLSTPRSESSQTLYEHCNNFKGEKYMAEDIGSAIEKAFVKADANSVIFAVGSLYSAKEINTFFDTKAQKAQKV